MMNLRILYHLVRADFLERTRRYSFLVMLGLVLWLGYVSASQQISLRVPPDYIGVINSAWVGALMTVTVTLFLGWLGFYLVKGSVSRDYTTGVGQIMATTPLTRPLYTLGKWLSNFAVLSVMILILLLVGILMNVLVGVGGFDLWALVAPLLFIALPAMAFVAAVPVLFESVRWLRGGFGNLVYFFAFIVLVSLSIESNRYTPLLDFVGFRLIGDSIAAAAKAVYPEIIGGFAFSITELADPKLFTWEGITWTAEVIAPRLFFVLLAIALVLFASLIFDRFNPAQSLPVRKKQAASIRQETPPVSEMVSNTDIHLTPLEERHQSFRFDALFLAELRLFLKGQRWWWYAIALVLVVAQFGNEPEANQLLLIASWTWPILLLSGLGSRESRSNTQQIIFSAPRPLVNQLPAAWLAAVFVMALLGSGALVRFILASEITSIAGWLTGVLFIPSLALCLGVWMGSPKPFEVIYIFWMYMLTQRAAVFDFLAMTPASPWAVYTLLTLILLAAAFLGRRWHLHRGVV